MERPVKKILVIRSCRKEFFLTTLYRIKGQYPEASITIFILPKMKEELEDFPLYDEVIYFPEEADLYHAHPVDHFIESIRDRNFDLGVVTMNNRYGEEYDDIKKLMLKICPGKVVAINCFGTPSDVNRAELSPAYAIRKKISVILSTLGVYLLFLTFVAALKIFVLPPWRSAGAAKRRISGSLS